MAPPIRAPAASAPTPHPQPPPHPPRQPPPHPPRQPPPCQPPPCHPPPHRTWTVLDWSAGFAAAERGVSGALMAGVKAPSERAPANESIATVLVSFMTSLRSRMGPALRKSAPASLVAYRSKSFR